MSFRSDSSLLTVEAEPYLRSGTAVVCLDRLPRDWTGDSVTTNNAAGALSAASHLIGLGHRQVAVISGPLYLTNSQDRVKGYKRVMREAGITVPPEYIQETTFDRAGGYARTKVLLELRPRPTAILAFNDLIALGALMAIRESRLRCPEDVSLIGFDGLDLTETTTPQISSVYQLPYQMGVEAVKLVMERLANKNNRARRVVLKTELKIRDSVGPPSVASQARTSGRPRA